MLQPSAWVSCIKYVLHTELGPYVQIWRSFIYFFRSHFDDMLKMIFQNNYEKLYDVSYVSCIRSQDVKLFVLHIRSFNHEHCQNNVLSLCMKRYFSCDSEIDIKKASSRKNCWRRIEKSVARCGISHWITRQLDMKLVKYIFPDWSKVRYFASNKLCLYLRTIQSRILQLTQLSCDIKTHEITSLVFREQDILWKMVWNV